MTHVSLPIFRDEVQKKTDQRPIDGDGGHLASKTDYF